MESGRCIDPPSVSAERDGGNTSSTSNCTPCSSSTQKCAGYWDSLFSGNLCCKLWFTVPRSNSRKLLSRLTDLLRCAVVDQRQNLNSHIPLDIFRGIAGHTRDKVCIANHKVFWPHPPTLLFLFGDMKVYGGAQCMGDMVVQNSSQLHWGVNLAPGVKAESSNCAGSDFMRLCPQCSDGLYCGGTDADFLKDIFDRARKEYWASRKIRAWKKKSVCWGYHGCGCIRPRALGLAEDKAQEARACFSSHVEPCGHDLALNADAERADRQTSETTTPLDSSKDALGWGRAFDWKEVFEKHKVNMCFDEWNKLKWLPNNDTCRPLSLHSLLEDEAFAHAEAHNESATDKRAGSGSGEGKKPWEDDPDASCIRIVRSASPDSLRRSSACVQVDRVVPFLPETSPKTHASEHQVGEGGEAHLTCTACPDAAPAAARIKPHSGSPTEPVGAVRSTSHDYVASVEFQRMWPVFLRVRSEDRTPLSESDNGEGEVVFLGCIIEAFHMRLQTQQDVQSCLDVIADVAGASSSQETHPSDTAITMPFSDPLHAQVDSIRQSEGVDVIHQGIQICEDTNRCRSASRGTAQSSKQERHVSSPQPVPQVLFESAPRLTLHGRRTSVRGTSNFEDLVGPCCPAFPRTACPESLQMNESCAEHSSSSPYPANKPVDQSASATSPVATAAVFQKALSVSPATKPHAADSSTYSTVLQGNWLSCPTSGHVTNAEVASPKETLQKGSRDLSEDPTADRAVSPSARRTARATQQGFVSSPSSYLVPERRASSESLRTDEHSGRYASNLCSALDHKSCQSKEGKERQYRGERVASKLSPRASSHERKRRDLKIVCVGNVSVSGVHAKSAQSDRELGETFEAAQALTASQSKETSAIHSSGFCSIGKGGFRNPKHSVHGPAPCCFRTVDIHDTGLYASKRLHSSARELQRRRRSPGFRQPPHARDYHNYREGGDMVPTLRAPPHKSRPYLLQRGHSFTRACLRAGPTARVLPREGSVAHTAASGNAKPAAITAITEPGRANEQASQDFPKKLCMRQECSSQLSNQACLNAGELLSRDRTQMGIEYSHYLKGRLEAIIGRVWCWRSTFVTDFTALHHNKPFSTRVTQEVKCIRSALEPRRFQETTFQVFESEFTISTCCCAKCGGWPQAMKNGFVPYLLMHYASTTCSEAVLHAFDMSIGSRRNIPFLGFSESLVDSFCSGIGHGMMYYSAIPGSVFPLHCEQGGLGAFNMIVGAVASYTELLQRGSVHPRG